MRDYNFNEEIFDNIDSACKSYWLGFLFADAYVQKGTNYFCLELASKDIDILNKFITFLGMKGKGLYHYTRNINGKIHHYDKIYFYSEKFTKSLKKLGFVNKTNEIIFDFDKIPNEFKKSFLLGLSDGDGTVYFNKKLKRSGWKLCLHEDLAKKIKKYLIKELNHDKFTISEKHHWRTTYLKEFYINGNRNVSIFLNWLYSNESVFLNRKYEKYIEFKKFTNNARINRKKPTSLSKYRGVLPSGNKYFAQIGVKGKSIYIGTFSTEIEAALAYNEKAKFFFKDKAVLNHFNES